MAEAMEWEDVPLGHVRPLDDQNFVAILEDDTRRQQRRPGQVVYSDYDKATSSLSLPLGDTDAGTIVQDYSEQLNLVKQCYMIDENYKITKKICGGKAIVYKCQDQKSKYPFVMKVLKSLTDAKHELDAYKSLRHENIVKFLGIICGQGEIKILLEDGGESVKDRYFGRAIPSILDIFNIMINSLKGIKVLHENGLVHCDLHLGNILIDQYNHVRICDHGSVRKIGDPILTPSQGVTVFYFPPTVLRAYYERIKYEVPIPFFITTRLDLYALAKIILELLFGKIFCEDTLKEIIYNEQDWNKFLESRIEDIYKIHTEHKKKLDVLVQVIRKLMSFNDTGASAEDALNYLSRSL